MNAAQSTVSAALSAANALLNSGTLVIYNGTMPASPETALSGQSALLTFSFANPAFNGAAFSGAAMQAQANFTSASVTPSVSGVASWARSYTSGSTAVADYVVGTAGTDIVMSSTTITAGNPETITSMVHAMPAV